MLLNKPLDDHDHISLIARLSNVQHRWHKETLLFQLNELQWQKGQTILLSGDNGAGKSTLMRLMAGLEPLQQGFIQFPVLQKDRFSLPWRTQKPQRGQCCYLHQSPYLFAGTVLNNLLFVIKSLPKNKRELAIQRLPTGLELAGLTALQHQPANTLSGGERQRIAALRAWLLQPKVLLLDEPTANLDQDSIHLITALVVDLIQQNSAVMISSHQHTSLTDCCNAHWMIKEGTVYAANSTTGTTKLTALQTSNVNKLSAVVSQPHQMDVAL